MQLSEKEINNAFKRNFLDWYCDVFQLKNEKERIRRMKEKPQAYRELLVFLEPYAKMLLELKTVVKQ